MSKKDSFVSLHNHSHSSLLDGLSTEDEYLEQVSALGQIGMGLTDHGNLFGLYQFLNKSNARDLVGVPGCEFYVAPENPLGAKANSAVYYGDDNGKSKFDVSGRGAYLHLTVWAYNKQGLKNLFALSSLAYQVEHNFQKPRIDFNMLVKHNQGLVISSGCPSSEISTRFLLGQDDKAYEYAGKLLEVFGRDRFFVEIMQHNMVNTEIEKILLPKQVELASKLNLELLATNDCHYAHKHDAPHHEHMLCIQSGSVMSEPAYDLGGKRFAFDGNEYYLKTSEEMFELFPERDFPRAITNTRKIADMVEDVTLDFDNHLRPIPIIPDSFGSQVDYYKHLVKEGLKERYGEESKEIQQEAVKRSNKEYKVITSSDFTGYMLTVRDYLQWTKDNFSTKDENGDIVASPLGAGRGCFLPGNEVTTNNGSVCIEDIERIVYYDSDTRVLTHDGSYQVVEDVFVYNVTGDKCRKIVLSSGEEITCTADHEIFVKNVGYVEAKDLTVDSVLLGSSNKDSKVLNNANNEHIEYTIVSIEDFEYTGKVYDLQVSHVHNYTISGVTVHNSVGGSIHAFVLGISEVDPIRHDLLFERFLSAGRGSTALITYDDGSTEEIIVSETKTVIDKDGNIANKYIHQLEVGDVIEEDMADNESDVNSEE